MMGDLKSSFETRVFGIVPAAGWSRRMGTAKQLLDVGGRTMLEDVLGAVLGSRAAGVMLVTREGIAGKVTVQSPKLFIALNDREGAEMIDSVRIGIEEWRRRAQPGPMDGFMVVPGDQPGLTSEIIDECVRVFGEASGKIVVASHAGKRGHPMIFPEPMAAVVLGKECDEGLNRLLRGKRGEVVEVGFGEEAVVRNVNDQEELERARKERRDE